MNKFLSKVKSGGRAAVIALTLGAASVVAMPAPVMAQNFSIDFGIRGGGDNFSFSIGSGGRQIRRACLNDREIRRGLRNRGWEDIRFVGRRGNRVTVIAEWGRNDYRLVINACNGRVIDRERIRRGGGGPGRPGGGFGLQFQFGN